MGTLSDLISLARKQVGYMEKKSNSQLDSHTANAGYNNWQKYSRDINNAGLQGYNGAAWCGSFQMWLDLQIFGKDKALELWNMTEDTYVGYNCFATYNVFAKVGKTGRTPKLGSLVIFTYSHMGRVIDIYTKDGQQYIECIEGNTSSAANDRNGGCVAIKHRRADESVIKGYCYIDYDMEQTDTEPASGWIETDKGWKFKLGTGQWICEDWWLDTNGKWSWFDENGIALSNCWKEIKGAWYYFGPDTYCLTSQWLKDEDKWYYLTADGSMARNAWVRAKDVGNDYFYLATDDGSWDGKIYVRPQDYPVVI